MKNLREDMSSTPVIPAQAGIQRKLCVAKQLFIYVKRSLFEALVVLDTCLRRYDRYWVTCSVYFSCVGPASYKLYRATKVALVHLDPSFTQLALSFNQDDGSYNNIDDRNFTL